jgi:heat shock protein HslJ
LAAVRQDENHEITSLDALLGASDPIWGPPMRVSTVVRAIGALVLVTVLGACGGSATSDAGASASVAASAVGPVGGPGLVDTQWNLVAAAIDSSDLSAFAITIEFTDTAATGFGGVNQYSASFTSSPEGAMDFGEIASTMMAGPEDAMAAEQVYLEALRTVTGYTVTGDQLDLFVDQQQFLTYTAK